MTLIGHKVEQAVTVRALRGAAPYIHMYKGKVFVIKAGGGAFRDAATMRAFVEQVAILHHLGIRVVLVHGGGPQLDEIAARLGHETRMVQGRRVTDASAIDATSMVLNGLVNTQLLALCRSFGIAAMGLCGVDGGLVQAHRRAPVTLASGEVVDYGMVGDIDAVDGSVLTRLLDAGFLPVVSPLSCDGSGQLLNINADTVAAALGGALVAEKLILCTGAPGILERLANDPDPTVRVAVVTACRQYVSGALTVNTPAPLPEDAIGRLSTILDLVAKKSADAKDPLIPFMLWMAVEPTAGAAILAGRKAPFQSGQPS